MVIITFTIFTTSKYTNADGAETCILDSKSHCYEGLVGLSLSVKDHAAILLCLFCLSFLFVCLFFLEKVKRNIIEQVYTCGLYQRCNKTNN